MKVLFLAILMAIATIGLSQKPIGDTTINGNSYPRYEGMKGGQYIIRTSATGKEYKQYLKPKVDKTKTVYLDKDIMYLNLANNSISFEVNPKTFQFKTLQGLVEFVEEYTAKEARKLQ